MTAVSAASVPLKDRVRRAEGLEVGDVIGVRLTVDV